MQDGTIQRFVSGRDWKTTVKETSSDWFAKDFDDASWSSAAVIAEIGEPIALLCRESRTTKAIRSARIYSAALGTKREASWR